MRRARGAAGRTTAAAAVVLASALLAACTGPAGEASPSASVAASGGASASATASTPPVSPSATPGAPSASPGLAGPLTLPACVDLLPLSVAQEQMGGDATVPLDIWETASEVMPGPAAADAVRGAVASQICAWGIPNSDGGFHVVAAELTPASAASLIASLRSAGTFTEQPVPGGVSFARDLDSEIGSYAVAYVFVGSAWTTAVGSLASNSARHVAMVAMDAVASANGG